MSRSCLATALDAKPRRPDADMRHLTLAVLLLIHCGWRESAVETDGGPNIDDGSPQDNALIKPDGGSCPSGTPLACSGDLHSILCNGNVVQVCPPTEGCAGGTCAPTAARP